jgi:hypothetical protein
LRASAVGVSDSFDLNIPGLDIWRWRTTTNQKISLFISNDLDEENVSV